MIRIFHHTHGDRDREHPTPGCLFDRRTDPVGDSHRDIDRGFRQDDDELISEAPAAHEVTGTNGRHQHGPDLPDELVARGIADGVVALQIVAIDQEQAKGLLLRYGLRKRQVQFAAGGDQVR